MSSLKEIRLVLGLSQAAMAKVLGTNRTNISMYELGQRPLPVEVIAKLHALHADLQSQTLSDPDLELLIQQINDSIRLEINARKVAQEQKVAYLESRLQLLIAEKNQLEKSLMAVNQILAQSEIIGLATKRLDLIQRIGRLHREIKEVTLEMQDR
jgi:transcriptional regulator with XRE-family HTH domain